MSDRAGYTVVVYAIDISPSMGADKADPGGSGVKRAKLDWAKECIARQCEPKIQSGRKTETVGVLTFGGRTNNHANQAWIAENPDDADPPYTSVSSEVAIQTVKPKTLEVVLNLETGEEQGNPISALVVALDMIQMHKHTKAWSLEIVLITDGESEFDQSEYEEAMDKLDQLGCRLSVVGIDFQELDLPVEKEKSRNKRLSEKFWRIFIGQLNDKVLQTTTFEKFLPRLQILDTELVKERKPHPAIVAGTVSQTHLYIGAADIDPAEAIQISIRYSKATMKARPPSLSKAWKAAVEMQQPPSARSHGPQASQLIQSLTELQSQSQSQHAAPVVASDLAAMISSDVKRHSTYVVQHKPPAPETQATQGTQGTQVESTQPPTLEEEGEEEVVDKEDLVKAWRFGSSWIPMEADTFEPLHTQKGVEVIGFVPRANIRHYMLIGEVRYVWPDMTSPRAQIEFSSFASALYLTDLTAIVRWVNKDDSEPTIGVLIPSFQIPEPGKKLDLMYWIKLPFADDEHKFWFPSLTKYKSTTGKSITEHPYIPTEEQCDLMDELVKGMDLDHAGEVVPRDEEEEEDEDEEEEEEERGPWFDPALSYNPVIHRTKEAIFHASLTPDLEADPLGPPHPDIVKYFQTPPKVADRVDKVTERLKEALDIKKVAPRVRKRANNEGLRDDEGYIDIDDLFDDEPADTKPVEPKTELVSPAKPKVESSQADVKPTIADDPDFIAPLPAKTKPKPKPGRLVSNERPLEDFQALVQGEGDVFRKAIQDLGVVVRENVAASFSRQAFPLALQCLEEARSTALMYEEVETYNDVVKDLEKEVKSAGFKHPDFWDHFTKAGAKVALISDAEAQEALEESYE
ncbi:ATP-dependent DNA helicase II subunit 2 [Vanrija pseudolonga]|uniref:ATP-dependent DNA helicase II subunit 2 n=1 Tax=Vanrija pseudolonga TaxID=143232 RepID=A0AAF0Y6L3_9TREE|nr:ATP-dependent DNA helicase II subunit 2 [Vanrija pseudolonga]